MSYPNNEPDELADDDSEHPADVVSAQQLAQALASITKAENERKLASQRVTDARKDAKAAGIDGNALAFIVRLSRMDDEDRESFLFRCNKYAALLKYQ